jgi:hypothetical protein
MLKPARIQIGRIRMKNGGADVRVLRRDGNVGFVATHMREFVTGTLNKERAPDAYAAIAFWFDDDTPGRPAFLATYCTRHPKVTPPLLVRMAAAQLISVQASNEGADRAITALGGETDDWSPDGVA